MTTSAHTSGLTPAWVPTDIAIGRASARKPEMFGTRARSAVAPTMSSPTMAMGRCPAGAEHVGERDRGGDDEEVRPPHAALEIAPAQRSQTGCEQRHERQQG